MSELVEGLLIYIAAPTLLAIGGYMVQTVTSRLGKLEEDMSKKVSQEDVRQLVADKIDPIREDIHEVKTKLDKVMDILITRK